jgi:hypothetical protein
MFDRRGFDQLIEGEDIVTGNAEDMANAEAMQSV